MEERKDIKRIAVSVIEVSLLLFLLILINVLLSYANLRWDITEEKLYTLSEGTKNIISKIKTPITIKFFYSKSNPSVPAYIKLYAKRVKEFLEEYEKEGRGKIRLEVYDPKPDSDEEEWAEKYGLRGIETEGGEKIYCGLVFLSEERIERIPFLDPSEEELLEYKVTQAIYKLQNPKKKVIGILSFLPVFEKKEWLFVKELRKMYEVRKIKKDVKRIDPDTDLLLIIHPKKIDKNLEYAIDQFILSGKNAIILTDPYCISTETPDIGLRTGLEDLFSSWGISVVQDKAVADIEQATYVRSGNLIKESPVVITAREGSFSKESVITSGLENMLFPIAGYIEKKKKDISFETLIHSSKSSDTISVFIVGMGSEFVRKRVKPKGKEYPIAVLIRGRFKSAFSSPPKGFSKKDHIKEAKKSSAIIVVADSDFLNDDFYVEKTQIFGLVISRIFNDNLNFLLNACEYLTGTEDLISIRTRGRFERPFKKVLELKAKAQKKWLEKEKELEKQAEIINERLKELEKKRKESGKLVLSSELEKEIQRFREQKIRIQHELREVRKTLRADIERLGMILKFINIFLMPLFISFAGIGLAIYRQRKTKR